MAKGVADFFGSPPPGEFRVGILVYSRNQGFIINNVKDRVLVCLCLQQSL